MVNLWKDGWSKRCLVLLKHLVLLHRNHCSSPLHPADRIPELELLCLIHGHARIAATTGQWPIPRLVLPWDWLCCSKSTEALFWSSYGQIKNRVRDKSPVSRVSASIRWFPTHWSRQFWLCYLVIVRTSIDRRASSRDMYLSNEPKKCRIPSKEGLVSKG